MSRNSAIATAVCAAVLALATATAAVSTVALAGAGVEKVAARVPAASRDCTVTSVPATDPVTGTAASALVLRCS
ncbi:hypothetical protein [Breoghania sp. L-A4]|uniref:hypothetical protein n=1 Tax=Breoghania sp. L-A4 TaxID=2304600 RepID=UPI000E35DD6C|nr:hypothetical protein [Breoghania sp. L-A4]AXS39955.1 hypothetical protein D1F64_07645 [Breoghania sp. L-A4]